MSPNNGHIDTLATFDTEDAAPLTPREHGELIELDRVKRLQAMADGKVRAATHVQRTRARASAKRIAQRR